MPSSRETTPMPDDPHPAKAPDERQPQSNVDLTRSAGVPEPAPKQPNDRDEQAGMTGGRPDARVAQGAKDQARGLGDTSRGEATDAAYDKQKRP